MRTNLALVLALFLAVDPTAAARKRMIREIEEDVRYTRAETDGGRSMRG